jgi:hypothetical protein
MAKLHCENDCTNHSVLLDEVDNKMLSEFVVDYKFASASYDENTKEIVIRLVDKEE